MQRCSKRGIKQGTDYFKVKIVITSQWEERDEVKEERDEVKEERDEVKEGNRYFKSLVRFFFSIVGVISLFAMYIHSNCYSMHIVYLLI